MLLWHALSLAQRVSGSHGCAALAFLNAACETLPTSSSAVKNRPTNVAFPLSDAPSLAMAARRRCSEKSATTRTHTASAAGVRGRHGVLGRQAASQLALPRDSRRSDSRCALQIASITRVTCPLQGELATLTR